MKWTILAGLLVTATIAGGYAYVATSRERTYRELIDRGEVAMADDDRDAAVAAFSGAIATKTESMLGYLKRGEAYARRGDYEAALPDLRRAAELDPTAPRPQELLGDVNHAIGRFDRAAHRFEAYLRLDDRSPRILYKLALARYSSGQLAAATAALRRAIALDDRFAEAHYLLALCLRDLQDVRGALASLQRSVALAPTMLQAREELADLYGTVGRQTERLKQLEALLALDSGPTREVALGLAYAEAGRLENAVLRLGEATDRYPDHANTYVALGRVWLETAQRDRAGASRRVSLTKALAALEGAIGAEDTSEALTLFGRALLMAGGSDERAEQVLRQATETFPVDPLAFYYLADAAERGAHLEAARRALLDYDAIRNGERDGPRAAALAERIADLSMQLKDASVAVRWYRRAADASPPDADLLTRLAEAQLQAGAPAAARATIEHALEKDPANHAAQAIRRRIPR